MKKFLLKTLITLISIAVFNYFFTFWIVIICTAFINIIFSSDGKTSALSGFLGVFLIWIIYNYFIDIQSDALLTHKIGDLLQIGRHSLLLLSSFLGGILGLIGGYTGYSIRKIIPQ